LKLADLWTARREHGRVTNTVPIGRRARSPPTEAAGGRSGVGKDFLDEIVERRSRANPEFPEMVEAALRARELLRSLAQRRRELELSQTSVAARMKTSQSALARMEAGEVDPRISTVERYALAIWRRARAPAGSRLAR
jgi:DNA-binding XRE family transcriptional regulator